MNPKPSIIKASLGNASCAAEGGASSSAGTNHEHQALIATLRARLAAGASGEGVYGLGTGTGAGTGTGMMWGATVVTGLNPGGEAFNLAPDLTTMEQLGGGGGNSDGDAVNPWTHR